MPALLTIASILIMTTISPITVDSKLAKAWLQEAAANIEQRYWNEGRSVYVEELDSKGTQCGQAAFMWDMGVVLAGYAAGIKNDRKTYLPLFEKAFETIEQYWAEGHGIYGYGVLPGKTDPDRYYDDNAWVALALAEAYEATKKKAYLDRSIATYQFVISCEDDKLGGGLYWHEGDKNGKNTCTNAPAINVGLRLYRITKEKKYLDTSLRLYEWMKVLQDTDGLYYDNQNMKGRIEPMKWTYNTALMIRANCLLFQITKDKKYQDEAIRVGEAAWQKWFKPELVALADEAAFAHHLFEAFFEIGAITKNRTWSDRAMPVLAYVHDHARSSLGLYGHRWDQTPKEDTKEFKLLFQASAMRAYAIAASLK